MTRNAHIEIWRTIAHSAFGSFILGALAYTSYRLHSNLATTSFLCLIVVVLLSFWGSLISGTILSVASVVALDYFFAPPILSLRISDPLNILALATFLTTTLTITYLVTRVRKEKQSSEVQRKEMKRLYELAKELLALEPEEIDPEHLLTLFCGAFALQAACLLDTETLELHLSGKSHCNLKAWVRVGQTADQDLDDFDRRISVRSLRVAGQVTGVIAMEGLENQQLMANAIAALAAVTLERTRAFHAAAHAAAVAKTEHLRGTLLDALAHAVKTPLATILTAVGGLHETGDLNSNHLEFLDLVESEAVHLGGLTTRLLRMANLDCNEVRMQLQQINITDLVTEELNLKSRQFSDHKLSLVDDKLLDDCNIDVKADPELLRLALGQLLENACKYSNPGSKVEVSTQADEDSLAIRVRNCAYIPVEEHTKIFDRFYRGKQLRNSTSGTGLGLDIARRIALAHGGTLALEDSTKDGSTFRISIPVAVREH